MKYPFLKYLSKFVERGVARLSCGREMVFNERRKAYANVIPYYIILP